MAAWEALGVGYQGEIRDGWRRLRGRKKCTNSLSKTKRLAQKSDQENTREEGIKLDEVSLEKKDIFVEVSVRDVRSFDESKMTNPKPEEHETRNANTGNVSELDELGEPAGIKYQAAAGGGAIAGV
ncbi:hypothetical protein ACFX15_027444 [Malus domestica]